MHTETPADPQVPVRYLVLPIYLTATPDEVVGRIPGAQVEAFGRPLG